ncbi:J domain-containing protein [Amnibacterium flavum]|uniref:J domain-containing protein n=1 Tax=Amnibacterium flavum TaxID=2173173 RepID=A0A2V1HP07_9MICO|nr:J domain-containing protein [Amnibacterium flavum]PVZ94255.1 hypothetical protein DDQ50_10965 [Amnibacterium flavum]
MTESEAAALLGVRPGASIEDVQHAFVRAARQNHPDLLSETDDEEWHRAGARFALLADARDLMLAQHPVIPVQFAPPPRKRRGIGGSVVILLLLAAALVAFVTAADAYRSDTVQNLRGGVIQAP